MDRAIHTRTPDDRLIVRYDRAGKWFVESANSEALIPAWQITLRQAVELATQEGSHIYFGVPGGRAFDAAVKKAVAMNQEDPP